jgi:hypothetical protein
VSSVGSLISRLHLWEFCHGSHSPKEETGKSAGIWGIDLSCASLESLHGRDGESVSPLGPKVSQVPMTKPGSRLVGARYKLLLHAPSLHQTSITTPTSTRSSTAHSKLSALASSSSMPGPDVHERGVLLLGRSFLRRLFKLIELQHWVSKLGSRHTQQRYGWHCSRSIRISIRLDAPSSVSQIPRVGHTPTKRTPSPVQRNNHPAQRDQTRLSLSHGCRKYHQQSTQ